MTTCNIELIQGFLDGELDADLEKELMTHLASCTACRQEYSRLKLLWLELACPEEIAAPAVLPYLRRQAITAAMRQMQKPGEKKLGFWESQKLAFSPLKYTLAYLPGAGQLRGAAVTAVRELPDLLANSLSGAGRLWKKDRGR
jgi:predicted anti-sigma-YlaC factor YlaD